MRPLGGVNQLGKCLGEVLNVLLQLTVAGQELDVGTILTDLASLAASNVLITVQRSETPLLGDDDLLLTGEFVLTTTQGLNNNSLVRVFSAARNQNLANVDTSGETGGLTPRTTHTLLETIGTSTRQHFVDTQNVVGVHADAEMEGLTARHLGNVFVGADTGSLQSLGRQLLVLVGNEVHAQGEVVDGSALATQVVRADLSVGDTTVVTRLGVRLVLAVTVATGRTASH